MSNKRSESVEKVAETFLHCRDKGHHWHHLNDKITVGSRLRVRQVKRSWECKGCGCRQEEVIVFPSCEVLSRHYVYPDGYLIASSDEFAPTRVSDVRRELFSRQGLKF